MIKVLLLSASALIAASSMVSACCLQSVHGRPHGGNTVVKDFDYRHGIPYHRRHHRRPAANR